MPRGKIKKRYPESKFFSMKVNPEGASIGNAVENFKPTTRLVKRGIAKAQDVASDIMSAPARYSAHKKMKQADMDVEDIKMVREMKKVQDGGDYRDPLFRARANVARMKGKRY